MHSTYPPRFRHLTEQHGAILALIGDIETAASNHNRVLMRSKLVSLIALMEQHFADEELVMRRNKYPKVRHHAAHHAESITNLNSLLPLFSSDELSAAAPRLAQHIRNRLIEDIELDLPLIRFLEEKVAAG